MLFRNFLKRWFPGDPIKATRLNEIVTVVNDLKPANKLPTNKNLQANGRQAIARFRIVSVHDDYLTCNPFRGDTVTADQVKVAKPYLLRRSPFESGSYNGLTFTYTSDTQRTANDGSNTEDQIITPDYVVNDEIKAFFVPIGGTGAVDDSNNPIFWEDINNDARQWAKVFS